MIGNSLPQLPVTTVLPELASALRQHGKAVLVAPPGAGKTSLVPLALLDEPWAGAGTILLLEPRRIAARAAARRMASLLGEEPGETVGYAMRMDRKTSARTRILVVTEGILARMIIDDPMLEGISAVIFDEFHERSLDGDFTLALTLDVIGALRPDLRLVVMSATLDGARVSSLLKAPVLESQGRSFPVDIRYADRPPAQGVEEAVASAIRSLIKDEQGSILAFLPGQREIQRTHEALADQLPETVDIIALHGGLEGSAQDAAIQPAPAGRRKVVLATSIAETSVTIDGVTAVVDCGFSRLPRYEPDTGLTRLETVRVSRASAEQRAGRAGRTAPGIALRLWRKEQMASLPAFTPPEILDADLSGLLLDCAAFGISDPTSLAFLDPPPAPALAEARALLRDLGAIDADGRLTPEGEAMRKLALPVRLAHMVVVAARKGQARTAARLAMVISERGLGGSSVDLDERLSRFAVDRSPRARAARAMADRLAQAAGGNNQDDAVIPAGTLLIHAWPDRVAKARGEYGRFVMANGRGGQVDAAERLAGSPWLVVADLQGQARNARITAAGAITENDLVEELGDRIEMGTETVFQRDKGVLRQRETRRLGAIILAENTLPAPRGPVADQALLAALQLHGLSLLRWNDAAEKLRNRLAFLHLMEGEPWPDVSDEALTLQLDQWLLPFLKGEPDLDSISDHILQQGLLSLLPYDRQRRIDAYAPSHFTAPTGSRVPIRYENGDAVLAIRVQELFGLNEHPTVGNAIPLTLELLSPAHRPIQKTRDLPGFWRGSWNDVRSEMRGRYPKHVWPEDPATATPTNRAKPRAK